MSNVVELFKSKGTDVFKVGERATIRILDRTLTPPQFWKVNNVADADTRRKLTALGMDAEVIMGPVKEVVHMNALQIGPKQHERRRWMSLAYHRRVQKKWRKRYEAGDKRMAAEPKHVTLAFSKAAHDKLRALQATIAVAQPRN